MRQTSARFVSSSSSLAATLSTDPDLARRVVVTGLGVISGCGIGHDEFFTSCVNGISSLNKVTRFDASAHTCQIASEVSDEKFNPKDYFTNVKNVKSNDRFTHFAVAASKLALEDAKFAITDENAPRVGVMVGSAFGGMETSERETLKLHSNLARPKVSPFTIPALLGNTAAGVIAIETNAKGPNYGVVSACASGTHSIGEAIGMIKSGDCDAMLAGGTEATITPLFFAGFNAMKAMATGFNEDPKVSE